MAYEERDNSGSLFKRDKTSDNQPDYSGPCMVDGKLLEIAAWLKKDRNGKTFMSLKFGPRRERQSAPRQTDLDDQVPF